MACQLRPGWFHGEDRVNFRVGPHEHHFEIHEKLISRDVPALEAILRSDVREPRTKTAYLPDEDSEIFDAFADWLYEDILDEIEIDKENPWTEPLISRMKLIIFAEKFNIDMLADYAIDTILLATEGWSEHDFTQPTLGVIQLIYENTLPRSRLRMYLASCSAICYACCKWGPSDREIDEYMTERNASTLREIMRGYLIEMADRPADHPSRAPICDYHRHGGENDCSTRSRKEALMGDDKEEEEEEEEEENEEEDGDE